MGSIGALLNFGKGAPRADGSGDRAQCGDDGENHKKYLKPVLFLALGVLIIGCGLRSVIYGSGNDPGGFILLALGGLAV